MTEAVVVVVVVMVLGLTFELLLELTVIVAEEEEEILSILGVAVGLIIVEEAMGAFFFSSFSWRSLNHLLTYC